MYPQLAHGLAEGGVIGPSSNEFRMGEYDALLQPCRKVISLAMPPAYAAQGSKGRMRPSLTGNMRNATTCAALSTNVLASSFINSATVLQPMASMKSFVVAIASSKELVCEGAPLCAMTFLKYCWEPLMSGCMVTLPAPADSPQMVTLSGSPPKAAIFS